MPMLDFLNQYARAISLDGDKFKNLFPQGVRKSDFLLFDDSTICEYKEVKGFNVVKRIEHLVRKNSGSALNLKRDLYKTINKVLSSSNQQIKDSREALNMPESLGLVIIENQIPNDLSILALMDAADRKMQSGLECIDGILCLDFINTFVDENGNRICPAQLVARDTERSERLHTLVGEMLNDFGINNHIPIHEGFNISKADQIWKTDKAGRYKNLNATLNIDSNKK